jgi:hypothetical protein
MADKIPAEIESRMFIKPIEAMPEKIVGRLSQEELEAFENKDLQKVLFAISKMVQTENLRWERFVAFVEQSRHAEAHRIEQSDRTAKNVRWIIRALFVAFVGALFLWAFKLK